MKRSIIFLIVLTGPIGTVWPIMHDYSRQITILSDEILFKAQKLAETTDAPEQSIHKNSGSTCYAIVEIPDRDVQKGCSR